MFNAFVSRLRKSLDRQTRILVKNSSWVFIATVVRTGLLFVRSVVLARTLGAEQYGYFALVLAFVGTVQEFFNLNLGTSLIKFGADYQAEKRGDKLVALLKANYLMAAIAACLSIGTIYVTSIFFYDTFIDTPGLKSYVVLYSFAGCTVFFDYISTSLLRLFYRFKVNSLIRIAVSSMELMFVLGAVYLYPGNLAVVFKAVVAAMLLNSLMVNMAALWEIRADWVPHRRVSPMVIRKDWKTIGGFIVSNSGSRTLSTLADKGDVLFLGAFTNATQVGLYTLAKKVAFMINKAIVPLSNSIYPQLSKLLGEGKRAEARIMLSRTTRVAVGVAVLLMFGAIFFGKTLMEVIYGAEYSGAYYPFVVHVITVLLMGVLFWSMYFVLSIGKVHFRLLMNIVGLIVASFVAYLLVHSYGAVGVALALLVARGIPTIAFSLVAKSYLAKEGRGF